MTNGSVEPLKKLHQEWGDRVQFVDLLTRQAHPGPGVEAYSEITQKEIDAERYRDDEGIPWPIVVDDLIGRVHHVYGGMADPTYIIDADGRVAFYLHWTNAPTLHRALEALTTQGGRGVVLGGMDRIPHVGAAFTDGWKGLARGFPTSVIDMDTAFPLSGTGTFLGHLLKPVLAPVTLKSRPWPSGVRIAAVSGLALLGIGLLARRRSTNVG